MLPYTLESDEANDNWCFGFAFLVIKVKCKGIIIIKGQSLMPCNNVASSRPQESKRQQSKHAI